MQTLFQHMNRRWIIKRTLTDRQNAVTSKVEISRVKLCERASREIIHLRRHALSWRTFSFRIFFFNTSKLHFVPRDLRRLHSRPHGNSTRRNLTTTRSTCDKCIMWLAYAWRRIYSTYICARVLRHGPQESKHESGWQTTARHKTPESL